MIIPPSSKCLSTNRAGEDEEEGSSPPPKFGPIVHKQLHLSNVSNFPRLGGQTENTGSSSGAALSSENATPFSHNDGNTPQNNISACMRQTMPGRLSLDISDIHEYKPFSGTLQRNSNQWIRTFSNSNASDQDAIHQPNPVESLRTGYHDNITQLRREMSSNNFKF
ncbi:unnamed protein product [Allacma fusca]|uniref:Uncharacterized protein n=1 Tax=Allacma fusca TaxID=39272 RepID=A0A8J2K302_9HEXA|nr:unnamed protein product [Allacma fusca]